MFTVSAAHLFANPGTGSYSVLISHDTAAVVSVSGSTAIASHVTGLTATPSTGTFGPGATILIAVAFDGTETVTGAPKLALNSGGAANYTSGSGTNTLTFTYVVGAGENTPHLDEASANALTLNSGTILGPGSIASALSLPAPGAAGSLASNSTIVIDTVAPTVADVNSPTADGTYTTGATIAVTVAFSEAVNVTGVPTITLNSGGTASYTSGSGTNLLSFTYIVGAGQSSADLDYTSASALALSVGTIKDAATNAAVLTLPAPGAVGSLGFNKNIVINAVTVTGITNVTSSTANGSYTVGAIIPIQVTFNGAVTVAGGTPTLALNSGGTASYTSGSGTATLTFTYTVGAGQSTADLDYTSASALALNGATIKDGLSNNAVLTLFAPGSAGSLGFNKNIVIDTAAPVITTVTTTTPNGTYGVGATVTITVGLSKSVNVTGIPTIALNSGGTATYTSGSGSASLVFTYTVGAGENSPHLDYTTTTALSLNGGTIADAVGNAALLTLPAPGASGSLGANSLIVIDTVAPTVLEYRVLFGTKSYNVIGSSRFDLPWQITGIQAVFSKPIASGDANSLAGLTTTGLTGLGTTTLTWSISALTLGTFNTTLLGTGVDALKDAAGNPLYAGAGFAENFKVLYGDFNDDGNVTSADMVGVYAATAGSYNIFADMNGDGSVSIADVLIVRSRLGKTLH